ncbi:SDR family NAD(P)-dependent oxidoreductase [Pleionea litopenaei]|uniref:SDR family NAD(P)-dependent oxidoreductase n=1 Tax=Pleionea litopenaei TaxID=3070815 RepID=A0AA51X7V6_9GAMM|nr:SDR family NAD(P)-dependent oxidoreductase [Pleionea sp. HL-JVS1]WMS88299.1 SDR family NAD(P)-dependent oxidoreductase [Pleionea sp. HL-JVS1]
MSKTGDLAMLERFKHRRVLITGGGSGLGAALVKQFLKLRWQVWIADIDLDRAQRFIDSLTESKDYSADFLTQAVKLSHCDISDIHSFQQLQSEVENTWGNLDVLINNAGIASSGLLEDTTPEQWNRTLGVNLTGVYHGCYLFAPLLSRDGPSHMVNVASFAGIALAPAMLSYNVSKAGVIALSESLKMELCVQNISVSVACPAFFETNLVSSMSGTPEAIKAQVNKWMKASKVNADQVAEQIVKSIDANKFMTIAHDYARKLHWLKRFFPNFYYRKVMAKMPSMVARLKSKHTPSSNSSNS